MPTVQSGKVLVTGANGYIAVWLLARKVEVDEGRAELKPEAEWVELLLARFPDTWPKLTALVRSLLD